MNAETLAAIRAAATTEQDALEIVNALLCNFKPNTAAGDALLDCSLVLDDQLNNTQAPTLEDMAALADFRRRLINDRAAETHFAQRSA